MRKKLCAFILTVSILIITVSVVYAADNNTGTAVKSSVRVFVNGEEVFFDAYSINGNNYFKLRDLAYVLSGTQAQFEVIWDAVKNAVSLSSGKTYTPVGGEMELNANAAPSQTARLSASKIFLDGKEISLTAYGINGNNYFKLRDIAELLDFFVGWDEETKTIIIDTTKRYVPELTAAAVYNKITALKGKYPHGMDWDADKYYIWKGGIYRGGHGCFAFAFILSDEAFGGLPARKHDDISKIKIGDIVVINNGTHAVVVIAIDSEKITVAEGNYNNAVSWVREFTWKELKDISGYVITRYPE